MELNNVMQLPKLNVVGNYESSRSKTNKQRSQEEHCKHLAAFDGDHQYIFQQFIDP